MTPLSSVQVRHVHRGNRLNSKHLLWEHWHCWLFLLQASRCTVRIKYLQLISRDIGCSVSHRVSDPFEFTLPLSGAQYSVTRRGVLYQNIDTVVYLIFAASFSLYGKNQRLATYIMWYWMFSFAWSHRTFSNSARTECAYNSVSSRRGVLYQKLLILIFFHFVTCKRMNSLRHVFLLLFSKPNTAFRMFSSLRSAFIWVETPWI